MYAKWKALAPKVIAFVFHQGWPMCCSPSHKQCHQTTLNVFLIIAVASPVWNVVDSYKIRMDFFNSKLGLKF